MSNEQVTRRDVWWAGAEYVWANAKFGATVVLPAVLLVLNPLLDADKAYLGGGGAEWVNEGVGMDLNSISDTLNAVAESVPYLEGLLFMCAIGWTYLFQKQNKNRKQEGKEFRELRQKRKDQKKNN